MSNVRKFKRGQSTIEFVFVMFAFIFFLSLSYNAVVSFAVYQYLSYANFMAARANQPSRSNRDLQRKAAVATMKMYVPGIIATPSAGGQSGPNGELNFGFSPNRTLAKIVLWAAPEPDSANFPFVLVFKVPLVTLPIGAQMRNEFGWVELKTSVILGREVSGEECKFFFGEFIKNFQKGPLHSAAFMEDNGC